jgi:outer membrane protein TolC
LPTLGATAQERFTNATGFAGRSAIYQIQANITWRLDASNISASEAQASAAKVQAIREERVLRARADEIKDAWDFVTAQTANARAARAEEAANRSAARLAKERYDAGTALQLDVLQADRQAFQSEVNRIQADANLAYARTALRLAASASKDRSR